MEHETETVVLVWVILLVASLALLCGCCKTQDPVTTIGDNAKEQISMAYDHLPKECKSAEREREFNAAINHVTAVVATCSEQKESLNRQIHYQSVAIAALSLLSIALFLGIIRSRLV